MSLAWVLTVSAAIFCIGAAGVLTRRNPLVVLALAVGASGLMALDSEGPSLPANTTYGSPEQIGELLLTKFLLPFEIASYLLTVAAVCAVLLARKRRGLEPTVDTATDGVGPIRGESR